MVSQCASTSSPICRDRVQGVREVDDGVEGEFGEVDGQNVLGCLGVWRWNSDMSLLAPLTSSDGLHSSSSMPYPFQCTRYSSFPLRIRLSSMSSTSYSWTPSWMTGGGGSC